MNHDEIKPNATETRKHSGNRVQAIDATENQEYYKQIVIFKSVTATALTICIIVLTISIIWTRKIKQSVINATSTSAPAQQLDNSIKLDFTGIPIYATPKSPPRRVSVRLNPDYDPENAKVRQALIGMAQQTL